jgi:K+-sensing histidine kinase KdpD
VHWRTWVLYLALWAVATAVFAQVAGRPETRIAHGVLTYLLLIIGASRQGGRALSALLVVLGFLAVDWFFVPPLRGLGQPSDFDLLILLGFAGAGVLVSELFGQLRRAAAIARERTLEAERLSAERLQLEREASMARVLVEADRLKNALIGSIAHDLRSPVATLALLADPAGGFAPRAALDRVADEARRLGDFIATLQRFAMENGGQALQLAAHDADHVVQTSLRSAYALVGERARLTPLATPVRVTCDLTLCAHIIGNLLQNAARYSPAHEPIDVSFEVASESLTLVVADRGPGLSPAALETLFRPLARASDASMGTAGRDARMGMGLAIARTFAVAQRGDVAYRAREGGGSEFLLRLPRAAT